MAASDKNNRRALWIVTHAVTVVVLMLLAFGLGYFVHWSLSPARRPPPARGRGDEPPGQASQPAATVWTCSMHPQVRQPKPGQCRICGMDLIPLEKHPAAGDVRRISLSDSAKALMGVETVAVARKAVTAEVRMVGKVDYDETRLAHITAWVPGRLDRLFVDYTGIPVRKGDHMVEIYSPELLAAQEEFLQARKAKNSVTESDPKLVRESVEATYEASRQKLRLLGLAAGQIDELARRGKASDRLTIHAPAGGIVVHKNAQQGMYVKTGTRIYSIADLSRLWVRLDAYESDLAWLRYGQKLAFTAEALPGREFTGLISFIDPVLTEKTRTVRVRVNVANPDGALKPGMFVRAVVRSRVAAGGKVMTPDLAGKWISPMHPEVIKDGPGKCDVCGMPLVRAESLGYVSAGAKAGALPLVIPVSAALRTGKRAIVYVEVPGTKEPTYEMREVTLGPRAGESYLVEQGLAEGERVVVRGNFKIDSERQIQGLPSMMDREGVGAAGHGHHGRTPAGPRPGRGSPAVTSAPAAFQGQLAKLFTSYFRISDALAADDAAKAASAAREARKALPGIDARLLGAEARATWQAHVARMQKMLDSAAAAGRVEPMRAEFALLSEEMLTLAKSFGVPGQAAYRMQCPMAFSNRGATWLQRDREVRNPYFGASMLRCGSVVETLAPPTQAHGTSTPNPTDHERKHPE